MHYKFRNVNNAFFDMVQMIKDKCIDVAASPSRYGDVLRITEPVCVTYLRPRERVLFNLGRDCNPFFHLFEALWMLAGRNDLAPIVHYNKKMAEFSDDGGLTQPDAYGYRWRNYFGWDQLDAIVDELIKDNTSRRVVLSMWDAMGDYDTASPIDPDFMKAQKGSKAVPCNTHAYFDIVDGRLDMTVCNRSNDMVWGMFGANVVHFSMLQEYLACCIGVKVGVYHQITNNLHVYTNTWYPDKFLEDVNADRIYTKGITASPNMVRNKEVFDREVNEFIDDYSKDWKEPFLDTIAKPMCQAFNHHKARQYGLAMDAMERLPKNTDWRYAGIQWLKVREQAWRIKDSKDPENAYAASARKEEV